MLSANKRTRNTKSSPWAKSFLSSVFLICVLIEREYRSIALVGWNCLCRPERGNVKQGVHNIQQLTGEAEAPLVPELPALFPTAGIFAFQGNSSNLCWKCSTISLFLRVQQSFSWVVLLFRSLLSQLQDPTLPKTLEDTETKCLGLKERGGIRTSRARTGKKRMTIYQYVDNYSVLSHL